MMNWTKEKPLTGTEGLIKGLYPISNSDRWFIQPLSEEKDDSLPDSFVQVGIPIQKIVEGLLVQRKRGLNE